MKNKVGEYIPLIGQHQCLKIVMEARNIPDGAQVTKITGQKLYTLSSDIKFYGERNATQTQPAVTADKTVRFLVYNNTVNIISCTKKLLWYTNLNELMYYSELR